MLNAGTFVVNDRAIAKTPYARVEKAPAIPNFVICLKTSFKLTINLKLNSCKDTILRAKR